MDKQKEKKVSDMLLRLKRDPKTGKIIMPGDKPMPDPRYKPKPGPKKMQPLKMTTGGMCRGMGAAIKGGKFEGVK
jgi:hypothetical protein